MKLTLRMIKRTAFNHGEDRIEFYPPTKWEVLSKYVNQFHVDLYAKYYAIGKLKRDRFEGRTTK